jgi:hypothetical protein
MADGSIRSALQRPHHVRWSGHCLPEFKAHRNGVKIEIASTMRHRNALAKRILHPMFSTRPPNQVKRGYRAPPGMGYYARL